MNPPIECRAVAWGRIPQNSSLPHLESPRAALRDTGRGKLTQCTHIRAVCHEVYAHLL